MKCDQEQLKKDIMRRVRRAYVTRTFIVPFIIECTVLVVLVGVETYLVSIYEVFANASHTPSFSHAIGYIAGAFKNTELSTQAISLAMIVVVSLVARDTVLGLRNYRRPIDMPIQSVA